MKRKILLFAAVATILAACTKDDGSSVLTYDEVKSWEPVQISFDSFMGERAVTRGGYEGEMTTTTLQAATNETNNGGGFGVFAYYTNGNGTTDGFYVPTTSTPNFMWNQLVSYSGGAWSYSPIKYWPNETKSDGDNGAISDHADKLSFFAYAPYVVPAGTSDNNHMKPFATPHTTGIISISDNEKAGDPKVEYAPDFTGLHSVDLLWGVSNGGTGSTVNGTFTNVITSGNPFIDLVKQQTDGKIGFNFKHALSRLALTVQAANNQEAAGGNPLYDNTTAANKTKIVIESVSLSANFPTNGILNLNNTTTGVGVPYWETITEGAAQNITISAAAGNLRKDLIYDGTKNAQDNPEGVITGDEKHLMAPSADDFGTNAKYFMFIPSSNLNEITVNIVYHVITDDENLVSGKIDVTNNITKVISVDSGGLFVAGKAYTFKLVLGVTSVVFEAVVENWNATGNDTTVNLPINVE